MNILTYIKDKLKEAYGNSKKNGSTSQKSNDEKLKALESYVNNKYGVSESLDSPPEHERYDYEAPTDDELKQSAEDELNSYLSEGEDSLRRKYAQKKDELMSDKAASDELYESSRQNLKQAYDEAREQLGNDSLKRGLARSSIALNNQAEAGKAYTESEERLNSERNARMDEIDRELNGLGGELQNALDSFKIGYAAKLTERINELKEEREKQRLEALKYNNSLLDKEYEQALERSDKKVVTDISSARKAMNSSELGDVEDDIMQMMISVLGAMPKEDARDAVRSNPLFRESLSDKKYYSLCYMFR